MKVLVACTTAFAVLSVLGFTVYFHDPNPWGGWFVPLWFGSLAASLIILSCVGISRVLDEIANPRHLT